MISTAHKKFLYNISRTRKNAMSTSPEASKYSAMYSSIPLDLTSTDGSGFVEAVLQSGISTNLTGASAFVNEIGTIMPPGIVSRGASYADRVAIDNYNYLPLGTLSSTSASAKKLSYPRYEGEWGMMGEVRLAIDIPQIVGNETYSGNVWLSDIYQLVMQYSLGMGDQQEIMGLSGDGLAMLYHDAELKSANKHRDIDSMRTGISSPYHYTQPQGADAATSYIKNPLMRAATRLTGALPTPWAGPASTGINKASNMLVNAPDGAAPNRMTFSVTFASYAQSFRTDGASGVNLPSSVTVIPDITVGLLVHNFPKSQPTISQIIQQEKATRPIGLSYAPYMLQTQRTTVAALRTNEPISVSLKDMRGHVKFLVVQVVLSDNYAALEPRLREPIKGVSLKVGAETLATVPDPSSFQRRQSYARFGEQRGADKENAFILDLSLNPDFMVDSGRLSFEGKNANLVVMIDNAANIPREYRIDVMGVSHATFYDSGEFSRKIPVEILRKLGLSQADFEKSGGSLFVTEGRGKEFGF